MRGRRRGRFSIVMENIHSEMYSLDGIYEVVTDKVDMMFDLDFEQRIILKLFQNCQLSTKQQLHLVISTEKW